MAKKEVSIKVTADGKSAKKELDALANRIKKIGDGSTVKGIQNVSQAILGLKGVAGIVTDSIGRVISGLNECTALYKVQEKAEKSLEAAARNNPYLDGSSTKALKDYASQLQSVSNYGDEQLIPMMSQLAAAGRTQEEIMKIMGAAIDYATGAGVSLESAVKSLNGTFGGLSGELGKSIPQIKELTKEQLKNGDAIDIIAEKYKGQAAAVQDSSTQVSNALGDLKEAVGSVFHLDAASAKPLINAIGKITETIYKANAAFDSFLNGMSAAKVTNQIIANAEKLKNMSGGWFEYLVKNAQNATAEQADAAIKVLENSGKLSEMESRYLELLKQRREHLKAVAEEEEKQSAARAKREKEETDALVKKQEAEKKTAEYQQKAADYIAKSKDALGKQLKTLELSAKVKGEEVSVQDKLNAYTSAYISLIANSGGMVTENNAVSKQWAETIRDLSSSMEESETKIADFQTALSQLAGVTGNAGLADSMQTALDGLKEREKAIEADETIPQQKRLEIAREFAEKKIEIEKQITVAKKQELQFQLDEVYYNAEFELGLDEKTAEERQRILDETVQAVAEAVEQQVITEEEGQQRISELYEEYGEKQKQTLQDKFSDISSKYGQYFSGVSEALSSITSLYREQQDAELKAQMQALDEQYKQGLITEEDYQKKKRDLERKAAQQQYKKDMSDWRSNLLKATVSIAKGVAKNLEQGFPACMPGMLLTAATGAAQIASIVANKPQPPAFASGGIVPGTSYTGDRVQANVNSGEMILNEAQQKELWNAANGFRSGTAAAIPNIYIYNNDAGEVSTKAQLTENKINIMIDKRVNESLRDGRYNGSLAAANASMQGNLLAT